MGRLTRRRSITCAEASEPGSTLGVAQFEMLMGGFCAPGRFPYLGA